MDGLYIPVRLEQLKEDCNASERQRTVIGTVYFKEGTQANEVARYVMKRQNTTTGIWLVQQRVDNPSQHDNVEDGCYVNVKDSKQKLEEGTQYCAMYYNGPNMFIMT